MNLYPSSDHTANLLQLSLQVLCFDFVVSDVLDRVKEVYGPNTAHADLTNLR
jgi:hypothetical protein